MNRQLTYGEACCIVLGLPLTFENIEKSKDFFKTSLFDVCYDNAVGPMFPFALSKNVIARYPLEYRSYVATRPSSPANI